MESGTGAPRHCNRWEKHPGQLILSEGMAYLRGPVLHPFPHSLVPSFPPPRPPPRTHSTMSDPWEQPWTNSYDSPLIAIYEYTQEKATLAGGFISSVLYGTPVHMFIYLCSLRFFGLF